MRRSQENLLILRQSGGAKIPGILITQPKGVARNKETGAEDQETQGSGAREDKEDLEQKVTWQRGGRRGTKRYKYLGDDSKLSMFPEDEDGEATNTQ